MMMMMMMMIMMMMIMMMMMMMMMMIDTYWYGRLIGLIVCQTMTNPVQLFEVVP